jgi:large subunit ribosomal protein L29
MKANITKDLDAAELQRQVNDSQEQLFRLRFQMGMGQTEGLKKYRVLKKDRARLLTALRAKEIAGEVAAAPVAAPKAVAKKKGK